MNVCLCGFIYTSPMQMPSETKGPQLAWNCSYRQLWAIRYWSSELPGVLQKKSTCPYPPSHLSSTSLQPIRLGKAILVYWHCWWKMSHGQAMFRASSENFWVSYSKQSKRAITTTQPFGKPCSSTWQENKSDLCLGLYQILFNWLPSFPRLCILSAREATDEIFSIGMTLDV